MQPNCAAPDLDTIQKSAEYKSFGNLYRDLIAVAEWLPSTTIAFLEEGERYVAFDGGKAFGDAPKLRELVDKLQAIDAARSDSSQEAGEVSDAQ